MEHRFADLGVSIFDEDFTLDPFPYIEDLYGRKDVLGFRADGMNFLYRFADVQQVIRSPHCRRELPDATEHVAREREYATLYPNRARMFASVYTMEAQGPGFVTKKLVLDFLDEIADVADFSGAEPLYERLGIKGEEDEYVEEVQTIPLRALLTTCGLPFSERDLVELQKGGMDYVKAFDNLPDEGLLKAADAGVLRVIEYLDEKLPTLSPDTLTARFLRRGAEKGISEERLKMNLAGIAILSLANTAGISSAYVMRTLVRNAEVRAALRDDPKLLGDDHVVTELLRRDNHVKALSRFVHDDTQIGGFTLRAGEAVVLFFPGVNMDPAVYERPLEVDLTRRFNARNQLVFGGSAYTCIGKNLGVEFVRKMAAGFVRHLQDGVYVEEDRVEVDGTWVTERIITRLPIEWD